MQITIRNESDIRESIPIEIGITDAKGKPKVFVQGLGSVEASPSPQGYLAKFWTMEKGTYTVTIKDEIDTWSKDLIVKEQTYISFQHEFGFFLVIFTIVSLGVYKWMKNLKRTKN